jgi:RNA polymerase sigma-70 factor (ECF subfamily)
MAVDTINKKSFEHLFDLYYNPLCNFALSISKDYDKAEDIVQEVFVQIWKKRSSLAIDKNIKNYLFTATKNKAIEWLRREKLFDKYAESQVIQDFNRNDVDELAQKYEMLEKLYSSVRQLPPKCQQVFKLGKINGLTYAEISEELNISVKTVENQMSRALKLLRTMVFKN